MPTNKNMMLHTCRSPSYFREEHAWPRAGAVTPPRPRAPPNFSWVAEPPTSLGAGVGAREEGGGGGATGRSLFSDFSAPSLAPRSEGGRRSSEEHPTARSRLGGGGGEEEGGAGDDDDDDDEWKAEWSRRLLRGPMHSEYQARFPWPPRSALRATSAAYAPSAPVHYHRRGRSAAASASNAAGVGAESGAMTASPAPQARSASPIRQRGRGRGHGPASGSSSSSRGARGGMENLGARGVSEPPRDRRSPAHSLTGIPRSRSGFGLSASVEDAAVQHGGAAYGYVDENEARAAAAVSSSVGEAQQGGHNEAPRAEDAAAVELPPPSEELGGGTRGRVSGGREWAGRGGPVAAAAGGSPAAAANVAEQEA